MEDLIHKVTASQKILELNTVDNWEVAGLDTHGPKTLHGFHNAYTLFHLPKDHMLTSRHSVSVAKMQN